MSNTTKEKKGLTTQPVAALLKAAYALTHRIHAVDKIRTTYPRGSDKRMEVAAEVADLRSQRDMIDREIARRCEGA